MRRDDGEGGRGGGASAGAGVRVRARTFSVPGNAGVPKLVSPRVCTVP